MLTVNQIDQLWTTYRSLGVSAFAMNHYDLAAATEIEEPQIWKEFLMEPEISDWIASELRIIQDSELKKLLQNVSKNGDRSVGKAQMVNALSKLNDGKSVKDGPIFIYTYVPLSPEQAQAENVQTLDKDIFLKGE